MKCFAIGVRYGNNETLWTGQLLPHRYGSEPLPNTWCRAIYRRTWIGCRRTCHERKTIPPGVSSNGNRRETGADGTPGCPLCYGLSGPAYLRSEERRVG